MRTADDAAVEPRAGLGDFSDLGRRVVQAARLAVAVHLFETSCTVAAASAYAPSGRRLVIGGAGPVVAASTQAAGEAAPD